MQASLNAVLAHEIPEDKPPLEAKQFKPIAIASPVHEIPSEVIDAPAIIGKPMVLCSFDADSVAYDMYIVVILFGLSDDGFQQPISALVYQNNIHA
jgi:hypothetical protein